MTEIQFFALVAKMRQAQIKWFTVKDRKWLDESMRLEKILDAEIQRRLAWYTPQSLKVAFTSITQGNAVQQQIKFS